MFPEVQPVFFDAVFDSAIVGVGEQHRRPLLPVYDFALCAALARSWDALQPLLDNENGPLLLLRKISRDRFWKAHALGDYLVWDSMHNAIMGVCWRGVAQGSAVMYSRGDILRNLLTMQNDSDKRSDDERFEIAEKFFQENMLGMEAGDGTPCYFWPV